ncbi:Monocarboxylate transporter [Fasciola gigantica]|uniref:Monocarboxylate transporter n=1 Tax=Fasciola gigantica TaxID=46835 RepID=A0A504Z3R0_FASGI|nr:Monocarboxylate transporter [Fasciola gigantica]
MAEAASIIDEKSFQDKGWAWVIVLGAFISHYLTAGYEKGYSVLYVEIINKFHTSSALAAGLSGFSAAIRLLLAPFAVALCNRYNDRIVVMSGGVLCFTGLVIAALSEQFYGVALGYGIIFGLGLTLVYTPSLTICTTYFKRRRSTALSLSLSGAGFAALTLPYFIVYLIEEYAYEGAVLLLGAITLHYCVTGALFRDPPGINEPITILHEKVIIENDLRQSSCRHIKKKITQYFIGDGHKRSYAGILGNPWMTLFLFSFCLNMMGSGPVTTLLIHHAENLGFKRMVSVQLLAIEGIVQIVVRIFGGVILDFQRIRPHRGKIWSITIALSSLIILCLAFAKDMTTLSVLMSLRGIALAVYISQQAVITADMCEQQPEHLKQAIGLSQIGKGVGVLVGSWSAGAIRDLTNQYQPAFLFLSGMQFIGALLALIAVLNVHRGACGKIQGGVQDALLDPAQNRQSEFTNANGAHVQSDHDADIHDANLSGKIAVGIPSVSLSANSSETLLPDVSQRSLKSNPDPLSRHMS